MCLGCFMIVKATFHFQPWLKTSQSDFTKNRPNHRCHQHYTQRFRTSTPPPFSSQTNPKPSPFTIPHAIFHDLPNPNEPKNSPQKLSSLCFDHHTILHTLLAGSKSHQPKHPPSPRVTYKCHNKATREDSRDGGSEM